ERTRGQPACACEYPRAYATDVRRAWAGEGGTIRRRIHRDAAFSSHRKECMKLRVLIVDDEAPARERLRSLLAELDEADGIGEAVTGEQALERTVELAPDVVLLDVRMPGIDGIEAARHMNLLEQPPAVIFTTAYDEYAMKAFDAQAVGYLLKPIRKEKLAAAL